MKIDGNKYEETNLKPTTFLFVIIAIRLASLYTNSGTSSNTINRDEKRNKHFEIRTGLWGEI